MMATATKRCKVCGEEYKYCNTARRVDVFRWQDVACSPQHAAEYFHSIAVSRGQVVPDAPSESSVSIDEVYYEYEEGTDENESEDEAEDFDYSDDSDIDLYL